MALNTLKCNHLTPLGFKGLKIGSQRPNIHPAFTFLRNPSSQLQYQCTMMHTVYQICNNCNEYDCELMLTISYFYIFCISLILWSNLAVGYRCVLMNSYIVLSESQ